MKTEIFVSERYELIALIFRLSGRWEFNAKDTPYQNTLAEKFARFENHPAVEFVQNIPAGFDMASSFAMHLTKAEEHFELIPSRPALFSCGRWTEENTQGLLPLVNEFYKVTNFAAFFQKNMPYYQELSARFNSQLYSRLDKNWFDTRRVGLAELRPYVSPNNTGCGYGPSLWDANGNIVGVHPILPQTDDFSGSGGIPFLVHEFCHSFSNPISEKWYAEDENFRKLCNTAVDKEKLPYYSEGITMAREYVTRANTIRYMSEVAGADVAALCEKEIASGFTHISHVYSMVMGV